MKQKMRVIALLLTVLVLLGGCSLETAQDPHKFPMPIGDVDVTIQYLPEKVDNPENLPVLKWLCLTDFGQGGGQGRVWNETAVHQLNEMLAQRNMPYRIQFIMLTNNSMPGYYNWFEQKEVKKLIKEADLLYGSLTADEMVQHLMRITDYAKGQSQPSLEKAVPYEECWNSTTVGGEIYGIRGVKPLEATSVGWLVAKKVIDEYGFTVEDFQGKYYWEMDDLFARLYEKNGNAAFLREGFGGGNFDDVAIDEDSAKEFIPTAIGKLAISGRFLPIGAFYAVDFGLETPRVVNLLEIEYCRNYQESVIRYADAGYLKNSVTNELVGYGYAGTDTLCEDEENYHIPVEPMYISSAVGGPTSGVCAATKHPEEALSLLALIGNDEEFRMQLAYGKEGQDYTISEDGYYKIIKREDRSRYSLDFLSCLNYFSGLTADTMGEDHLFAPTTRHNRDRIPEGKTLLQTYEERAKNSIQFYPYSLEPLGADSKSDELSFHYKSMKKELEKIEEICSYYLSFYANPKEIPDDPRTEDEDESRPRMSKEKYDEMLQALRDAGSDKIQEELQRQLDAWLEKNPEWKR